MAVRLLVSPEALLLPPDGKGLWFVKSSTRSFPAWVLLLLVVPLLLTSAITVKAQTSPTSKTAPAEISLLAVKDPIPVLAYYYIWYDSNSWDRAKIDTPLLGTYTSDDLTVMRQHIREAKAAGIDGFIVSWKSTYVLNRRLDQLAQVAQEEDFKLAIIYQGLDFNRNPLPVDRIASDLDFFIQHYASLPVFQLFSKPLVIWSGTWKFSPQDINQVTQTRRDKLLLLASERDVAGYTRLATMVDGNAYYWSSVNPDTYPGYGDKLVQMGQAVHNNGGLWIAPAAPGFDARLIGGTSVVDRKNGETFRTEINTAMASSPDILGIISWNEFSENSHIEPSVTYGSQYLDILSEINHLPAPTIAEFDSSEPVTSFPEVFPGSRAAALGGLAVIIITGLIVIIRRNFFAG
jgi:hypothetical protein